MLSFSLINTSIGFLFRIYKDYRLLAVTFYGMIAIKNDQMRSDLKWSVEFPFFRLRNLIPIFEHLLKCLLPIWETYCAIVNLVCKLPVL